MPITDLTGTKWQLNLDSSYNPDIAQTFSLNFISNGVAYSQISFFTDYQTIKYVSFVVFTAFTGWTSNVYKTIIITGGTDATNSTLINWLQNHATQLEYNTFSFGNLPIENVYFGTRQVKKIYMGNALVWEKATQSFSTIHLCGVYEAYAYTEYAVNSSSTQTISQANNAGVTRTKMTFALAQQYSLTLSDVSSLKIRYFDEYKIYASDGSVIADWSSTMPSSIDLDGFYEFISALSEGCYVCVYYND